MCDPSALNPSERDSFVAEVLFDPTIARKHRLSDNEIDEYIQNARFVLAEHRVFDPDSVVSLVDQKIDVVVRSSFVESITTGTPPQPATATATTVVLAEQGISGGESASTTASTTDAAITAAVAAAAAGDNNADNDTATAALVAAPDGGGASGVARSSQDVAAAAAVQDRATPAKPTTCGRRRTCL